MLGRIVFGFRDDLNLPERWWHRLLKVLGFLLLASVGIFTYIIVAGEPDQPTTADVTVITTLRDFAKRSDPKLANVVPMFVASPGRLGGLKDGKVEYASEYYLSKSFCTADIVAHAKDYAAHINADEPDASKHIAAADVEKGLKEERANRKPGEEIRYCGIDKDVGFESSEIVKYSYTTLYALKIYGSMAGTALGVMAAVAFVMMNLYYRGMVYVICGPRKPKTTSAPEPVA